MKKLILISVVVGLVFASFLVVRARTSKQEQQEMVETNQEGFVAQSDTINGNSGSNRVSPLRRIFQTSTQISPLKLIPAPTPTPTPDPFPEDVFLLPDLSIVEPKQIYIVNQGEGKKTLRFSTTFTNIGQGPLEIYGQSNTKTQTTYTTQFIKKRDGSGEYHEVGNFVFHPTHGHWHLEKHVLYQVWRLDKNQDKGEELASTDKMSFCIWDENSYDLSLPGAPQSRVYNWDCDNKYQGLSVGWSDTYTAQTEGQELDISSIPDGSYILTFEVNPDKKIIESDYDNNAGKIYITIDGNKLSTSLTLE